MDCVQITHIQYNDRYAVTLDGLKFTIGGELIKRRSI